jgi:hypothetical protein
LPPSLGDKQPGDVRVHVILHNVNKYGRENLTTPTFHILNPNDGDGLTSLQIHGYSAVWIGIMKLSTAPSKSTGKSQPLRANDNI